MEVVLELEKHHFATIMLRIGSGKSPTGALSRGKSMKSRVLARFQCLVIDCLPVTRKKKGNDHVVKSATP